MALKVKSKITSFFLGMVVLVGFLSFIHSCSKDKPDEQVNQAIKRITSELNLKSDQINHLEELRKEFLRESYKKVTFAELFNEDLTEKTMLDSIHGRLDLYKKRASEIVPKIVKFYSSLDDGQKEQFLRLIRRYDGMQRGWWWFD